MPDEHKCNLPKKGDGAKSKWARYIQIWERSPRTNKLFRSSFEIDQERRKHALSYPRIIHPCSKFRTYYEIWMIFVILATVTYFPVYSSFPTWEDQAKFHPDIFTYSVLSLLNFIDIVLTFTTGYVGRGYKVVCDPKKIAKHYFYNNWLVIDVILFIVGPLSHLITKSITRDVRFAIVEFCFLCMFKLSRLLKYVRRFCKLIRCSERCKSLLDCLILIYTIWHWTACLFFMVPKFRWIYGKDFPEIDSHSWMHYYNITPDMKVTDMYVRAMYRSCSSLLSIKRQTTYRHNRVWEESVMEATTYIVGKIIMGWVTVIILEMFLSMGRKEREYQETMNQITGYMCRKNLPAEMQRKVVRYYEYKFNRTVFRDNEIIDSLSGPIVNQFRFHEIVQLIQSVSLFENLDQATLECFSRHLKPEVYLENDIIIRAGEVGDCMYFIMHGTVAALTPTGEEICHLQDGAFFGEICMFLRNEQRPGSIIALERCTIYRLEKKAMKICIKNKAILKELENIAVARLAMLQEKMARLLVD